jgi:hypothetical protein
MSVIKPGRPNPAAIQSLGEELAALAREKRRQRSREACHRPAFRPQPLKYRSNSEAYVPQVSSRLLNDPGLSDGARRCAFKLIELTYRRSREDRALRCTVNYLAKCLHRSERTVQNYLAQLRGRGYIQHDVVTSSRARMCIGIFITLLRPVFPRHHAHGWPESATKSGVKQDSQNYSQINKQRLSSGLASVEVWTWKCRAGVFRALMKTLPTPAPV